jgi:hypothetical protein
MFMPHPEQFHDHRVVENIWEEAEDGPWNIVYDSNSAEDFYHMRAATFNKLIQRLTSPPAVEAEQALHDSCMSKERERKKEECVRVCVRACMHACLLIKLTVLCDYR